MLLAGLFVWFQFRNQNAHATPPAILLACVAAPIVSALLGWYLAPTYVSWRKAAAVIFVPFIVIVGTAFSAACLYMLASNVIRSTPVFAYFSSRYVLDCALMYIVAGSLIWAPGFIATSLLLIRASSRAAHS